MTKDVMEWLRSVRKLDAALLAEMQVQPRSHDGIEGQAVAFPYIKNGKIYAAKFRGEAKRKQDGSANFRATTGVSREVYNIDALSRDADQPIVITEGEIDCLSVMQSGFLRAISLPDGWTEQGNKVEPLVNVLEALRRSPFVVVAGDNDAAGESLPKTVANILAGHDVRYVTWPDGCKDANDVLVAFGEGVVAKCINEARRIDPPGGLISGFSDLPPMSDQRVLKLGKAPFDKVIALEVGEVSVWTGLPGSGKSTFLLWLADEISQQERVRIGLIGFETHPHRIRDQLSRSHSHKAWADLSEGERQKLLADLDRRWRIVHATVDENHLGWLEAMVKALAIRDRCKVIVIDPWNELEHLPEKGESMTQYINFALKVIRGWAKTLEVHIALVAHPAKIRQDGKPRPPTGYDIADSAAFFNKPGLGVTIHEGDEPFQVQLVNWKTRDTLLYGTQKGRVTVEYAPAWGCYRAIGQVEHQAEMGI